MYHALLSNRYLRSRVIPLIAVAAVALCTALVIIVVSVMTGFVDMVRNAGKTLMGDVIVSRPLDGIPHYDRLIERIMDLPEAVAATPVVDTWGLLKMPYGGTETVQVWGIEPASFAEVTGFAESLNWREVPERYYHVLVYATLSDLWNALIKSCSVEQLDELRSWLANAGLDVLLDSDALTPHRRREIISTMTGEELQSVLAILSPDQREMMLEHDPRLRQDAQSLILLEGRSLQRSGTGRPGIVLGIHVSEGNDRQEDGSYVPGWGFRLWMPSWDVTLTLMPVSTDGAALSPETFVFPVVNEYQSGVYMIDDKRVMIPIDVAQRMLRMNESSITDPHALDEMGLPVAIGTNPARATMVLVRAADGVHPRDLKRRVVDEYGALQEELLADEDVSVFLPPLGMGAQILTWDEQNAQFIGPVEKERDLMRILFSIVYFVCAGLVLVIFWAIVYEKTRDIGTLRSIGASRVGILWIFVRYGLAVGVVGAFIGLGLAYLVVSNINLIHRALGDPVPVPVWATTHGLAALAALLTIWRIARGPLLPVVIAALSTIALLGLAAGMMLHEGFLVWDPKVYYFTEIPNEVDTASAIGTMIGAVFFSALGAMIPAARAGDVDPVVALRYE